MPLPGNDVVGETRRHVEDPPILLLELHGLKICIDHELHREQELPALEGNEVIFPSRLRHLDPAGLVLAANLLVGPEESGAR